MIESAELRRQLGTRGRALVEREFTLAKVIAETLKVYEGLIQ